MAIIKSIFLLFIQSMASAAIIEKGIEQLNKDITVLESRLGHAEKYYNSTIKMIESTEKKSEHLKEQIFFKKNYLANENERLQKILMGTLVHSFANGQHPENLMANKIMVEKLKEKKKNIQYNLDKIRSLEKLLTKVNNRYKEYIQTEKELSTFVLELQGKRKNLINRKAFKESSLVLPQRRFGLPLKKYTSIEYNNKGITLKFDQTALLYSTEKGKIAYVGPLSSYGNLIMIDHGQDTRSILLGSFRSQVKKGQQVKKDEPIGMADYQTNKQIYFEIRKNNEIQNTGLLIDKKLLAKGKVKSTEA